MYIYTANFDYQRKRPVNMAHYGSLNPKYFKLLKSCEEDQTLYGVKGFTNTMIYFCRNSKNNEVEPVLGVTFICGSAEQPDFDESVLSTRTNKKNVLQFILSKYGANHIILTNLTMAGDLHVQIFAEKDPTKSLNGVNMISPGESRVIRHSNYHGFHKPSFTTTNEKILMEKVLGRKLNHKEKRRYDLFANEHSYSSLPLSFTMNVIPTTQSCLAMFEQSEGAWGCFSTFLRRERQPTSTISRMTHMESDGPITDAHHSFNSAAAYNSYLKYGDEILDPPRVERCDLVPSKALYGVKLLVTVVTDQPTNICRCQQVSSVILLEAHKALFSSSMKCLIDPSKQPNNIIIPCGHWVFTQKPNEEFIESIDNQCPVCYEHVITIMPTKLFQWG